MADCIIFNAYLINDAVSFEQLNHALYIGNGYFRNFRQECPISVMPPTKTNRKKKTTHTHTNVSKSLNFHYGGVHVW